MAYSGFLIKVGSYTIPFRYIEAKKYKCSIKGQDLDSYRDANGVLHREALSNVAIKVEWETPNDIDEAALRPLMDSIRSQYSNATEKKALVTAWMPEIGNYVTMDCYLPDVEYQIDYADENTVKYGAFRLAFIGYGGVIG
ncbi:DUF6711 family protein [Roseburia intestinalis]|uniref:Phage tail protein n=1 Tax=Roseburia intestinalis TaxID=166486 RepID=A0A413YTF5_9FIRM|nr:DUF6711 family protein [Roseburia intestinalis]RHC12347.1 hypothetical protein DW856_18895 [Roseburia intestinalis]